MRSGRLFLAALFSLLLMGMQHELLVHEIDHLRAKVQRGNDTCVQSPTGACVECELLAAGSHSAPISGDARALPTFAAASRVAHRESLTVPAPPAYYRSRAPPAVL